MCDKERFHKEYVGETFWFASPILGVDILRNFGDAYRGFVDVNKNIWFRLICNGLAS